METVNWFTYLDELYRCVCETFKIMSLFKRHTGTEAKSDQETDIEGNSE